MKDTLWMALFLAAVAVWIGILITNRRLAREADQTLRTLRKRREMLCSGEKVQVGLPGYRAPATGMVEDLDDEFLPGYIPPQLLLPEEKKPLKTSTKIMILITLLIPTALALLALLVHQEEMSKAQEQQELWKVEHDCRLVTGHIYSCDGGVMTEIGGEQHGQP